MSGQLDLLGLMAQPLRLEPIELIPCERETSGGWEAFKAAEDAELAAGTTEVLAWGKYYLSRILPI